MNTKELNSSSRLVNVAARLLSMALQDALLNAKIKLTVEQWRILYYVWDNEGISQSELIDLANKEKSTITRQITLLEKGGFIYRKNGGRDNRNKRIYLTAKGKSIKEEALNTARVVTEKSERNITAEKLTTFKTVLNQIIFNIKKT